MLIGNKEFDLFNRTYVMGILNVTPDSFSDGGKFNTFDKAMKHAEEMVKEGVDILDIGGESTRPSFTKVSAEEEMERVMPVIDALKKEFDVPISLDTYKGEVAEEGIKHGVDLINDIWGLKHNAKMAEVIAKYNVPCCLMHNKDNNNYDYFVVDMLKELEETLDIAKKAGISSDKIILDPGVGFGKDCHQNLLTIKHLAEFKKFGLPLLLGTSRKSVIGLTLDLPSDQRLEGTLATTVMAVQNKYGIVRVHDVLQNKRIIAMTEAILNA